MKKIFLIFIILTFAGAVFAQKAQSKRLNETELAKLRKLAVEAFKNKKNNEAIDYFTKIINSNPDYLAYCLRAETFARQNNVKAEIADYFQAVKLLFTGKEFQTLDLEKKYDNVDYLWRKLLAFGDAYDKSIESYTKFIEANPQSIEAYIVRGGVFHKIAHATHGKMQDTLNDYNQAIKLKPVESWFYYMRGVAYQAEKKYDLAEADYKHYLKLNPNLKSKQLKNRMIILQQMKNDQKRQTN